MTSSRLTPLLIACMAKGFAGLTSTSVYGSYRALPVPARSG